MAPRSTRQSALTKKHVARLERERRQTRAILWGAVAVVAIIAGLIAYYFINEKIIQPRQVVAVVGEDKITTAQFQARVRLQRQQIISQYAYYQQFAQFGLDVSGQLQQLQDQLADYNAEALGQNVLDAMINELVMMQEAEKLGITISEKEIDEYLQTAFGYFPNGEPTATPTSTEVVFPTISSQQAAIVTITPTPGTPTSTPTLTETASPTATITATLDLTTTATASLIPTATIEPSATPTLTATATLTVTPSPTKTNTPAPTFTPEPTATPLTKEGYETNLAESMKNIKEFGFSETDYRNLVKIEILRTRMFDYVTRDMKPIKEQVWARHILVADEETAKKVYDRLKKGEDFAVVAAEVSTDTSNKDSGGDLGWFGKGEGYALPFEEAAFSQKPGVIGKPVQTDFGWHIIQVIGHEDRPLTADQFEQAKQESFSKWLEALRFNADEKAQVEIFDIWKTRVPLEPTFESASGQGQ